MNRVCLTLAAACATFFFVFLVQGTWLLAFATLPIAIAYLSAIALNSRGRFELSRALVIVVFNLGVTMFLLACGENSGLGIPYFAAVCVPLMLYDLRERWKIALGASLPLALYTAYFCLDSYFPPFTAFSQQALLAIRISSGFTTFGVLISSVLHILSVTEQNERALAESLESAAKSEEEYQQILDSITDLILVKGAGSRLIWANRAFREFYGMTNEELKNLIDAPFNQPDYTNQYIRDDLYVYTSGKNLDIPAEPITRHDGQVFFMHTVKSPIFNRNGEVIKTVGVSRDITERLKDEVALRQANEKVAEQQATVIAASKMSALGEMAGGIAHEINNPLTIIHLRASQLRELASLPTIDPKMILLAAEKIELTATRISKIVRSLKSFARDAHSDPSRVEPVAALIEETVEFCRERFRNHDIQLHIDPIDPSLQVECKSVQISQVLLNLLNNAHDAVEKLTEKRVRVSAIDTGDRVQIRVIDSGPGIPENLREKIFAPFFTTKEVGKGTGLGLSVSMGITENHGGRLYLDTAMPNTCFVLELRKAQLPVQPTEGQSFNFSPARS